MEVADVIHEKNVEIQNSFSISQPNVPLGVRQMYKLLIPDLPLGISPLGITVDELNVNIKINDQINPQTDPAWCIKRQTIHKQYLFFHHNFLHVQLHNHLTHLAVHLRNSSVSLSISSSSKISSKSPSVLCLTFFTTEWRKQVRKLNSPLDQ